MSNEIDDLGNPKLIDETAVIYINPEQENLELIGDQLFRGFIPINSVHLISDTDVALIHLNLPVHKETGEFIPIQISRLSLLLPELGDQILAFGYDKGIWSQ